MNYKDLLKKVIPLVEKVGMFAEKERKKFNPEQIVSKTHNNLVSYVDTQAEDMLVTGLHQIFPEAGFITEENSSGIQKKEINWVIDPIDGTTNFLHNVPWYGVNVALMAEKDVLIAISYFPRLQQMFYATKGGGAWQNRTAIQVSQNESLQNALVAQGFPYDLGAKENAYFRVLQKVNEVCRGFRHTGSAALDMAYVANGTFDAYFEYSVFPWDIMPGILLVKEAGGFVSDFYNTEEYWDASQIVAAGAVHKNILTLIQSYW